MTAASGSPQCLDNDGNAVPWWFMYKTAGGFEFAYVDGSTRASSISKFSRYMNDTSNPIALTRTLQALVEDKFSWFQYNDQPDIGTASSSYGHSKGVVAFNPSSESGFWLTHSTPKFPASSGIAQFYFPETEVKYGQTFLCVELDSHDDIEKIGAHLQVIKPFLYFSTMDQSSLSSYPNIMHVLNGDWITKAGTMVNSLDVGGLTMTALSKNKEWNDALWGDLVAPYFQQNLIVQSWIRGYAEGAYCTPTHQYDVVDTQEMQMPGDGGGVQEWSEGADHSKWCVSSDSDTRLVCIGDINRMTSQFKRGGGAICFEESTMHDQLTSVIESSQSCSS